MVTEQEFLNQVKNHKLTVIKEDGLYRHLLVGIPGQHFESWNIHTWPGYLAMVGDMGDWVFQRTEDMLGFFRSRNDSLNINPEYWAEKLQAQESEGWRSFCIDEFNSRVKQFAVDVLDVDSFDEIPDDKKQDLEIILSAEDEYEAVSRLREFDCEWLDLADFWDCRGACTKIRDHYIFACYAIAWTVKLYDLQKSVRPQ